ncbi:MAG: hypothetical protein MUP90_01510 [Gammaproteobacteria bacterium]|nr:hypothetical protein [Gammaproteobacteria bacterium]
MNDQRSNDLNRFYSLLAELERKLGGPRLLSQCSDSLDWPERGVYFFREAGENRGDSEHAQRIVRVGTHALKSGASTTLWNRLSGHKGLPDNGGGNHRGSILRMFVGQALCERDGYNYPTWGESSSVPLEVRQGELPLEQMVSAEIGAMPFLWLAINDEPGPESLRGYIERNAIALLSNYGKHRIDPPSEAWLGNFCERERVRHSGLWNPSHVTETYDPAFLGDLEHLIDQVNR